MYTEVESIAELKRHWEARGSLRHVVAKDLDLRGETEFLLSVDAHCAVFLGCPMEAGATDHVVETGGVVFPHLQELLDLPFRPYRDGLYTLPELMDGLDVDRDGSLMEDTPDGRIYRWFREQRREEKPPGLLEALAERLHDHAIDDALHEFLDAHSSDVVGIMGGHALSRSDPVYADVARLARSLARKGWLVTTGGGPGAMEAGNLGAWVAPLDDDALDTALEILRPSPTFGEAPETYLAYGYRVLEALSADPRSPVDGRGGESLAVPTWYYGHEPSNQFATHVAKYFANSVREAGLVTIATRGIVFAPGRAGTVQEIFMDATQNYYGSEGLISPMVLLGRGYWTERLPVERLLRELAGDRDMAELVAVFDDVDRVVAFLESNPARAVEGQ
ncbi:MAG: Rossmann fold nucleotide-binding protein [Gemmatimonadota bacterium]|nr:Rossmann fold nucleotide-binding protein [Gemmatimonadota bacterium]